MNRRGNIAFIVIVFGLLVIMIGNILQQYCSDDQKKMMAKEDTRNEIRREAILRGVATYVVDINGIATFVWTVPLKVGQ
jgi:hypothetical protein